MYHSLLLYLLASAHSFQAASETVPALFYADKMRYDDALGLLIAEGHVEIEHEGRVLEADRVTYNEKADLVTATGNIRIRETTGEIGFSDYAELTGDLKEGIIKKVRILMEDNARLVAKNSKRFRDGSQEYDIAAYSPCDLCQDDPSRPLVWGLHARKARRDETDKTFYLTDAHMEFLGVPVFYSPSFSTPMTRRSGFLTSTVGRTNELGWYGIFPYYWVIDPDKDLTLSVIPTAKQSVVFAAEYREVFKKGKLTISGSGTKAPGLKTPLLEKPRFRGHLLAEGRWDVNDQWRAGFDVARTSDPTFFRRYPFFGHTSDIQLESRLYGEYFNGADYGLVEGISFYGLSTSNRERRQPFALPSIKYSHVGAPQRWGSYWTFDAHALSLYRHEGTKINRLILQGGWNLPFKTDNGQLYKFFVNLRGDLYRFRDYISPLAPQPKGQKGRLHPQVGLDMSWPFGRPFGEGSLVIEPKAQIIYSPPGGNPSLLPNEDGRGFEFSDAIIFAADRYPGYDIADRGSRATYGVQLSTTRGILGKSVVFLGQTYSFNDPARGFEGSGLQKKASDYVGRFQTQILDSRVTLSHRFRWSKKNLRAQYAETGGAFRLTSWAGLSVNHIFISKDAATSSGKKFEQVSATLTSNFAKFWIASVSIAKDLRKKTEGGGLLSEGVSLDYRDECFGFGTSVSRYFYQDKDIRPGVAILFRIFFKNLGEFQQSMQGIAAATGGENP